MSFCKSCISGVTHEGSPVGEIEKLGGFDTYVSKPQGNYPKDKAVVFLSDIFGIQLFNNQLLVDDFARNGFQVYAPDYHHGKPVPADALGASDWQAILGDWVSKKDWNKTRLALYAVVNALKEQGITTFAATGYCFGARYAFDLAFENIVKVVATAHPTFILVPADLQKLMATSKAPLLINQAEDDEQFPLASQKAAQEYLGDGKYKPVFETTFWPGTVHGFSVRGDLVPSKPEVKAGKEGAFKLQGHSGIFHQTLVVQTKCCL